MSKKRKVIIGIVVVIIIAAAATGGFLWWRNRGTEVGSESLGIYAERVGDLKYMAGSVSSYSGVVESQETLEINKDSDKEIDEIYVAVGDEVAEGDALFKYDVESVKQQKQSAGLELEGLKNDLEGYQAQVNQLTTEKQTAAADQQLDYTLQIQQAQLQVNQTSYDITAKNNEIAKFDEIINNAVVYSKMDGMVKSVNEDGVGPDGNTAAVITILATGDYRVKGTIDEQSLYSSGLSEGISVIVRSRADESITWNGTITTIDTENPQTNNNDYYYSDSSENSASKYPFYIQLDSSEGLMLGQHVYVEPDYGQAGVKTGLWLDSSYVVEEDTTFVWTLDSKGKLEKRTVEIGERDDDMFLVQIASGLSDDDYIVWPSEELYEGMKVTKWEDVDWDAYYESMGEGMDEGVYDEFGTEYMEDGFYEELGTEYMEDGFYEELGTEYMEDGSYDESSAGVEVK